MLEARALVAHTDHAIPEFSAHGPRACNGEAGAHHGIKESLPTCAGRTGFAFGLRLLEGIVDGDRKAGMCLLGDPCHRLRHTRQEEGFGIFLTAVTVGRSDQLLCFWHGKGREQTWKDASE